MYEFFKYIINGVSMTTENRKKVTAGFTVTWRAFITIVLLGIYFAWNTYNENSEANHKLLIQITNDLNDLKGKELVASEYKNFDVAQHQQIFARLDKCDDEIEGQGEDIAELFGFTGMKTKHYK